MEFLRTRCAFEDALVTLHKQSELWTGYERLEIGQNLSPGQYAAALLSDLALLSVEKEGDIMTQHWRTHNDIHRDEE